MYSIGEKIKELRKEQNMTQAQLADKLGVSYQAVSKWENGTSSPDISLIPDITKAFSISADVLFDLVNPEVKKEEIYADYRDILDNTSSYLRARKLLERAVKEFPMEYKFYIMLGTMVFNCIKNCDASIENPDIQYAVSCYDKVIQGCDNIELVDYAKIGKCVIYENLNLKENVADSTAEALNFMKKFPDYMRLIDPNWSDE